MKKELPNNDSKTNIDPGSQSGQKNTLGSSKIAGNEKNDVPLPNSSQAQEENKEKSMAQVPQTQQADKKIDVVTVLDDDYDNLPSSDDECFDQQPQQQELQQQQQQPQQPQEPQEQQQLQQQTSLKGNQSQQQCCRLLQQQQSEPQTYVEDHHYREIKSFVKNINNNNVSAPRKHLVDDIIVDDDNYDNLPSSSDEDDYICTNQMVGFD